jgi:hypothetical protein
MENLNHLYVTTFERQEKKFLGLRNVASTLVQEYIRYSLGRVEERQIKEVQMVTTDHRTQKSEM